MEKIEIKTQTAVEWLEDSLKLNLKKIILECDYKLIEDLFKQAKVKEKEQIIDAFDTAKYLSSGNNYNGEKYYKDTFSN